MNIVSKSKAIEVYKELDLYRAKYRHADFTPHAWCFHGNRIQGWVGQGTNHRLLITDYTIKKNLSIDTSTFKYLSLNIEIPEFWVQEKTTTITTPCSTTYSGPSYAYNPNPISITPSYIKTPCSPATYSSCKTECASYAGGCITNSGSTTNITYYAQVPKPERMIYTADIVAETSTGVKISRTVILDTKEKFIYLDMSAEPNWAGTISTISINVYFMDGTTVVRNNSYNGGIYHPICYIEYVKVDKDDLFVDIKNSITISAMDINSIRATIETYNKGPINWGTTSTIDDRVSKFINSVKTNDFTELLTKAATIPPYNNCANCDSYTCACYGTHYGAVPCSTCNGCNQFQACQTCDGTCYTQATTCKCYSTCYMQAKSCTCYGVCYENSTCACNGTCYTQAACSCNASCANAYSTCGCEGCNACDDHDHCSCESCYSSCDVSCDTNTCGHCDSRDYDGPGCASSHANCGRRDNTGTGQCVTRND